MKIMRQDTGKRDENIRPISKITPKRKGKFAVALCAVALMAETVFGSGMASAKEPAKPVPAAQKNKEEFDKKCIAEFKRKVELKQEQSKKGLTKKDYEEMLYFTEYTCFVPIIQSDEFRPEARDEIAKSIADLSANETNDTNMLLAIVSDESFKNQKIKETAWKSMLAILAKDHNCIFELVFAAKYSSVETKFKVMAAKKAMDIYNTKSCPNADHSLIDLVTEPTLPKEIRIRAGKKMVDSDNAYYIESKGSDEKTKDCRMKIVLGDYENDEIPKEVTKYAEQISTKQDRQKCTVHEYHIVPVGTTGR